MNWPTENSRSIQYGLRVINEPKIDEGLAFPLSRHLLGALNWALRSSAGPTNARGRFDEAGMT